MTQTVEALLVEIEIHFKTIANLHRNLKLQRTRAENAEDELMEARRRLSK